MKITLFLLTEKGFEVLKSLINNGLQDFIKEVIVGEDKNIQHDFSDEIRALAQQHQLKVYTREQQPTIESDYAIAVSWRWLINLKQTKLIVFHDSLLPKYRGFSPLVNMLINQEGTIGVTALFASTEYDKGDIIAQESKAIQYPITIQQAIEQITPLYAKLAVSIVQNLANGQQLKAEPQNEEQATYSVWRNEDDYQIDWSQTAEDIHRKINAVGYPYKGAKTSFNKKVIRIFKAKLTKDVVVENRDVGKVLFVHENQPVVICGRGLLTITDAIYDESGKSCIPLPSFRIKFE